MDLFDILSLVGGLALFLFDCNAGPVTDILVGACVGVKEGGFAAVGVAGKGNFNTHNILSFAISRR